MELKEIGRMKTIILFCMIQVQRCSHNSKSHFANRTIANRRTLLRHHYECDGNLFDILIISIAKKRMETKQLS